MAEKILIIIKSEEKYIKLSKLKKRFRNNGGIIL